MGDMKEMLDQIKGWLGQNSSLQRVADDPRLMAELILLMRMIYADGISKPEEVENFKNICHIAFGIPKEEVPKVTKFLEDYGYETTVDDAAHMFSEIPIERKRSLLLHMLSIAKADHELHEDEIQIIQKTASILGVSASDLAKVREQSS